MCPPCSASKVRSFETTIPSAAASTTAVFIGVPAFLKALMNFCTSSSISPRVSGLPRFLDGMVVTAAPEQIRSSSRYRFLKKRTVLSPRFGSSDLNFLRAAELPFSAAYFPTLARCSSLKVVYFRRFVEGCWLLCSSRTRCTALLASFVATAPIPVSSGVGSEETGLKYERIDIFLERLRSIFSHLVVVALHAHDAM